MNNCLSRTGFLRDECFMCSCQPLLNHETAFDARANEPTSQRDLCLVAVSGSHSCSRFRQLRLSLHKARSAGRAALAIDVGNRPAIVVWRDGVSRRTSRRVVLAHGFLAGGDSDVWDGGSGTNSWRPDSTSICTASAATISANAV